MKPNYSFQKRQKELEKKKKKAEKLAKKAAGGDQSPDEPSVEGDDEADGDVEAGVSTDGAETLNAVPQPRSDSPPLKP
jgi:hypothetical protein